MSSKVAIADVFVVDDDPDLRALVCGWLTGAGYRCQQFESGEELLAALQTNSPMAVCLDVMMPGLDGLGVLERMRDGVAPSVPVLVLTARDTLETAVACMRLGAIDYVVKPVDPARLLANLARIRREAMAGILGRSLKRAREGTFRPGSMIGDSESMQDLYREIRRVASSQISVCISGESGTGKELVAVAIHEAGELSSGPFVALNCGAIPAGLQASELFGHQRGAFTGATTCRAGRFEQANGGTIFLDEVAELDASAQVGLLRVLQERCVERVGGSKTINLDLRVVCASHRDLRALVADGLFREDLYYRLAVYQIEVPPLRNRLEDIPLLVRHFLAKHGKDATAGAISVQPDAMSALCAYEWPGNVRELENVVHGALVRAEGGSIDLACLPDLRGSEGGPGPNHVADLRPSAIADLELEAISDALKKCGGNRTDAAKLLGISRATLYRRLSRYGLKDET